MIAAVLEKIGERLRVSNIEKPTLLQDEVLVEIIASAINHRDIYISKGEYAAIKTPCVLGSDGAGKIVKVGNPVLNNHLGKEVIINPNNNWGDNENFQSNNYDILLIDTAGRLNNKTNLTKKYETINLLLNIAGADDKLSLAEDKLLNKTAAALELDLERFQQMKTSTIANIETVEGDDENEDTIFNFTPGMTDEDKCKKLRIEYTRWNRQTNNSNEKIRLQAKKMTELAANLRKKYNC